MKTRLIAGVVSDTYK